MAQWFRYESRAYSISIDPERELYGVRYEIELLTFEVVRETACGAWITLGQIIRPRFCRFDARRRYACPTKREALESFIARKKRQNSIHQTRANHALIQQREAERMLDRLELGLPAEELAL